jgi:signal transduction histidine kinase
LGESGYAEFYVSDQGIGIPAAQQPRLFEPFYRVDSSLGRRTQGVGLGLFLCKAIVKGHGGHIWVESTPGKGSTFRFTLPLR